jgi:hypothetical protein
MDEDKHQKQEICCDSHGKLQKRIKNRTIWNLHIELAIVHENHEFSLFIFDVASSSA